MVKRGFSASNGFWNTSCAWRRKSRSRSPASPAIGAPAKVIAPPVGSTSFSIRRPSVVLPQPDSPTMATASPSPTSKRDAVERVHGRMRAADDLAQRARHREVLHDIAKLDERCHVLGSNAAVRRVSASLSRWQAERWAPLPFMAASMLQAGWANGQRGTKRQPDRRLAQVGRAAADRHQLQRVG